MIDFIFALIAIPAVLLSTIAWIAYAYRKGLI